MNEVSPPKELSATAKQLLRTTKPPKCRCPYCQNRNFYSPELHDIWKTLSEKEADELLAMDEALTRLEHINGRQSQIVECRFFGDMTIDDTAAALDLSTATVKRDWRLARAWLYREIQEG